MNIRLTLSNNKACIVINDEVIETMKARDITKNIMKLSRERSTKKLIELPLHGHSFINLKNSPESNSFIGNYTNKISDKIISFAIAARTSELYTGNMHVRNGKPANTGPKCPYCKTGGQLDTIFHRLNGCLQSRQKQVERHNMIAKELKESLKKKFRDAIIKENSTVRISGMPSLEGDLSRLKPDITVITDNAIEIIEISSPYDMRKEDSGQTVLTSHMKRRDASTPHCEQNAKKHSEGDAD